MIARIVRVAALTGLAVVVSQTAGIATQQMQVSFPPGGGPQTGLNPGASANRTMEIGSGVILGRVVAAGTKDPISGSVVTLNLAGFTPVRVLSDPQGRFAFRELPKGRFNISVTRSGYVDGAFGRTRPGGPPQQVELSDDQRTGDIEIPVWKFAAIAGTVLDEHNDPLVSAPVRVLRRTFVAGRRSLTTGASDTTDDRGQYRIGSLEPGEYIVVLPVTQRQSLDGLIPGLEREMMGAMGAGGGGGGGATFTMAVRTEISGGGPISIVSGSIDGAMPPAGMTEDGQPLSYQTEFYTGALSATRATPITLGAGEERNGVDFRLTPVRTVSIGGSVTGPDGAAPNVQLRLIPAEADELVSPIETATTSTDGAGNFTFTAIPVGQYVLHAMRTPRLGPGQGQTISFSTAGGDQMMIRQTMERAVSSAPLPTEPTLWAEVPVGAGSKSITDLAIPLRTGLRVSGLVSFSGAAPQPAPDARGGIGISLEPADGRTAGFSGNARGRVDANGQFTTTGVPVGKYILRVSNAPKDWTLRSAMFGGRDITETAVELRDEDADGVVLSFTDKPSEMNGTVRDGSGNIDPSAAVIVFPADRAGWTNAGSQPRRLRNVRSGRDGSYTISALPPGDYFVIAIDDAVASTWQDPAFLEGLARNATRIRVGEGEKKTQPLTSTKGPS